MCVWMGHIMLLCWKVIVDNQSDAGDVGDTASTIDNNNSSGGGGGGGAGMTGFFKGSSYPLTAFTHVIFKLASLGVYLFSGVFVDTDDRFIIVVVAVVLLCAVEFWIVKNVSGRLLVGLRWWNEIRDDGVSVWKFESAKTPRTNGFDSRLFWGAQYAAVAVWFLLGLSLLLQLRISWLLVVAVAFTLSAANLWGYIKCSREHTQKIREMGTRAVASYVMQSYTSAK